MAYFVNDPDQQQPRYPGLTSMVAKQGTTPTAIARGIDNGGGEPPEPVEPPQDQPAPRGPGVPSNPTPAPPRPPAPTPAPTGSAGGSDSGGAPTPAPRPGAGVPTLPSTPAPKGPEMSFGPMAGDLGAPSGRAGSFRNIQNFLSTNAAAEADYARRNFAQPMYNEVSSTVNTSGNIPTWAQYSASQYPVSATVDAGTQATGSTATTTGSTRPTTTVTGTATAYPAPPRPPAPAPASGTRTTSGTVTRTPVPAAPGTPVQDTGSMGNVALQQQAQDQVYRLGTAANPNAYASFLQNRGGTAGANRLDAYLYGASPGGAQNDVRNIQQNYSGLLGLVGNQIPFGSTVNAQGQAVNHPDEIAKRELEARASGTAPISTPRPPPPPRPTGTLPTENEEPQEGDVGTGRNAGKIWDGSAWIPAGVYNKRNRDTGDRPGKPGTYVP